ncbi:MAG: carboxypeptidase regulatory-like domain-containing protein [Planctomycetes bacterium]|nr:carboxypeptidase regulatory-like domain-containing protein [Planctomycetota bacterium]
MTQTWTRSRRPAWAWLVGLVVLAALTVAVWSLVTQTRRHAVAPPDAGAEAGAPVVPPAAEVHRLDTRWAAQAVGGTVLLPGGGPAAGATVTIQRAITAWPEWRAERIDQAITGPSGTFEFRVRQRPGLLLEFSHPSYAGGLEQVPLAEAPVRLQLQEGFELFGVVTNLAGALMPNARVAIESVLSDDRRSQTTTTAANGAYRFSNLRAGPVRLIAHHEAWYPATVPVVVIGDQVRRDLTFERPGLAPLRGRVTSAVSQLPIAGATVELLPVNTRPGLADPIVAESAEDGTFLLSGLPRGNMRIFVRHPEYGAFTRTLAVGPVSSDVAIELPPRSQLSGQLFIEDESRAFLGGQLLQFRDSAGQLEHCLADADGRFRCETSLSPGWANVRLLGSPFVFLRSIEDEWSVRVEDAGHTEVELAIVQARAARGRVVDENGEPLAGTVVSRTRLLAESARMIGNAFVGLDITSVGSQVAQLFRDERDEVVAIADAEGRFEVRGRKPGPLLVRFDLPGRGSRWLSLIVPVDATPAELPPVVLPRGCGITGRVLRGGRGLAGAAVTAVGTDSQAMTVTRGDGTFAFDDMLPGDYRLRARLPSLPSGSREVMVRTTADGPAGNVMLVLDTGRTVRGVVSGSDGQPVPSALITVRGAIGQTTLSDSSGDFLLELPEREVELQISLADRSRQQLISVPAGMQTLTVHLDTPSTCTLSGQIAGLPGKQRLAGALLRCVTLDGDGADARARWVELQNGHLQWSLCPVGRVRIEVWSDGFAPFVLEREFVAGETYDLGEVLLEPGARLAGVVRDENGEPVANAAIWLGEESDADLFEPAVRTAADGGFRIGGVTTRSSRLVVRATGYAPGTVDLVLPQDVLSATPLVVTLERGATIEVQLSRRSSFDGGFVQLRQRGRVVASTDFDEAGRAWFANRSAGRYAIALPGSELPALDVVVAPGVPLVRVRVP